jgi:hypothetical protein
VRTALVNLALVAFGAIYVAVCWAILARLVPRLLDALIDLTDRTGRWWAQRRRAATGGEE